MHLKGYDGNLDVEVFSISSGDGEELLYVEQSELPGKVSLVVEH